MEKRFPIHARTQGGLEGVLAQELKALGASKLEAKNRVVTFEGDQALLYKANLWCRTAIRILRPIAAFPAPDEDTFYKRMRDIDWRRYVKSDGTLLVDAHVFSSFTTHSLFLAQLAKDAVCDQFRDQTGRRPSVDRKTPDLRIGVHCFHGKAQIFLDASGESLHRRGYRLAAGEAPLSEVLAAGILKLVGWDGTTPLVDPMCGSGTFLAEAGLIAKNLAPGLLRAQFGFQKWDDYDAYLFAKLEDEARAAIRPEITVPIRGIDIDPQMVAIARGNLKRAGLDLDVEAADFFAWDKLPENPGQMVMNPPYDERMKLSDVTAYWSDIGERVRERYAGWNVALLCGNAQAARSVGVRPNRSLPLYNGAIDCRLLVYETKLAPVEEGVSKFQGQADALGNRLRKNLKHYSKWAKREQIAAYRLYDRDIPELPFVIDKLSTGAEVTEIPRNYGHTNFEHADFLEAMLSTTARELGVPRELVILRSGRPAAEVTLPPGMKAR